MMWSSAQSLQNRPQQNQAKVPELLCWSRLLDKCCGAPLCPCRVNPSTINPRSQSFCFALGYFRNAAELRSIPAKETPAESSLGSRALALLKDASECCEAPLISCKKYPSRINPRAFALLKDTLGILWGSAQALQNAPQQNQAKVPERPCCTRML